MQTQQIEYSLEEKKAARKAVNVKLKGLQKMRLTLAEYTENEEFLGDNETLSFMPH